MSPRGDVAGELSPGEMSRADLDAERRARGARLDAGPAPSATVIERLDALVRIGNLQGRDLRKMLAVLERIAVALEKGPPAARAATPSSSSGPAPATGGVASERELDGQYGNPEVRRDPPRWQGESCKGKPFSMCPPDYLEELQSFLDWKAAQPPRPGKEEGDGKAARYAAKDARLARGWAARLRAGFVPPPPEPEPEPSDDDNPIL